MHRSLLRVSGILVNPYFLPPRQSEYNKHILEHLRQGFTIPFGPKVIGYKHKVLRFLPPLCASERTKTAQPIRCQRPRQRPVATDRLGSFDRVCNQQLWAVVFTPPSQTAITCTTCPLIWSEQRARLLQCTYFMSKYVIKITTFEFWGETHTLFVIRKMSKKTSEPTFMFLICGWFQSPA